jgi:putative transposase
LKIDRSLKAKDVINRLVKLFVAQGIPAHFCSENEPEFVAQAIGQWLGRVRADAV